MVFSLIDLALATVLGISLYSDFKERRIYNIVIFSGLAAGFLLNLYYLGSAGLLFSAKGFFLGCGLLLIPYLCGGLGAGDVKLLAAVGAMKGAEFVFSAFLLAALSGGVLTMALLIWEKKLLAVLHKPWRTLYTFSAGSSKNFGISSSKGEKDRETTTVPYAAAILAGTVLAFFWRF